MANKVPTWWKKAQAEQVEGEDLIEGDGHQYKSIYVRKLKSGYEYAIVTFYDDGTPLLLLSLKNGQANVFDLTDYAEDE